MKPVARRRSKPTGAGVTFESGKTWAEDEDEGPDGSDVERGCAVEIAALASASKSASVRVSPIEQLM